MKITMIAALTITTTATALPLAAIAHSDTNSYQQFQSPSGNIRCKIDTSATPFAGCQIEGYTYVAPRVSPCDGGPTDPNTFGLHQGQPGYFVCDYAHLVQGSAATLDYGQSRSLGPITCDSEPSGVTCTDSSTGHFFRVSRDSYQLG